ncbi:Sar family guanine nucleotide exchange factor SEC12 KNAG_0D00440 [Huiozyma naganishii CBS 8797]|uniref:Guanine nucleotide-exchange factor SEC12 n=1 Tax=Huiozyma naganishii (strain ATCC MYA-139 / BCRC 22969 / CBS 8797 / KCTC 17520 / NBRC 10181 / NCYC 3082 / Yp74L-3) TaxID=1071383 RepID=J7RXI4_HUIN7|nr:hypothetical protein KNAG_0D00440 [Kazachstania naganishii CBS 8797]CCK69797.1 hypothetical protein KNAG_0D00440 [Kazachstania naganishii CBS 8797]
MKFPTTNFDAGYPLYGAKFIKDDTVVVAGGGGEGKNGIPNKLTVLKVSPESGFDVVTEVTLSDNDDSPTAMDALGPNGTVLLGCNENSAKITSGEGNKHLRKFQCMTSKGEKCTLKHVDAVDLDHSKSIDDYTKLIELSPKGDLAAVVSSKENPSVLKLVDSKTLATRFEIESPQEIKDISVLPQGDSVCFLTPHGVNIVNTKTGKIVSTLSDITEYNLSKCKFIDNRTVLVASTFPRGRPGVVLLEVDISTGGNPRITKKQIICHKYQGITAMDLNNGNKIAALATNSNDLLLVNLVTYKIVETIAELHAFAVTKVTISPDGTSVVSVSAANTVHLVKIPTNFETLQTDNGKLLQYVLLFLLILAISVFLQRNNLGIQSTTSEYLDWFIARPSKQSPKVYDFAGPGEEMSIRYD